MIAIRAVMPADVPSVLGFVRDLAAFEGLPDEVKADEGMLTAALFGEGSNTDALIAEIGGKPVGIAVYFRNFSTWTGRFGLYLEDLYVTPEARGRGVGRALIGAVAAVAVAEGAPRIDWAVLEWNSKAIAFYESLGAHLDPAWRLCRLEGEALNALAA